MRHIQPEPIDISNTQEDNADRSQRNPKSTRNFQSKAESTLNEKTTKKYEDFICARTRIFYAKRGPVLL
ncbi:hypothetical protein T11_5058 [Trichinella zimbabwensis]|uniref:Uncharacterized protein n=1 Tax=Trichinella zimbabwensis TaxID=268475 RepID=A0A0V1GA62_9BILA|nr:hypothetical protein T11_5058 [Trichinella zimbabwensis]